MTVTTFMDFVYNSSTFDTARGNLETHQHLVELPGFVSVFLSYYNQPVLYEFPVTKLTGDFKLAPNYQGDEVVILPFPCTEYFCPSFNAKNSLFIDYYKYAVEISKSQFVSGLPNEFVEYRPVSIKCAR